MPDRDPIPDVDARRKAARRTALWVAAVAVAVYIGFILKGAGGA